MISIRTASTPATSSTSAYVQAKPFGSTFVDREDEKADVFGSFEETIAAATTDTVKEILLEQSVVSAVLLKADGTSEEIEYTSSSKQCNELMQGRPTVVGALEEIGVIVVRSLSQSSGDWNPHTLPAPLCNEQFKGDYLLYRADSQGKAADLSLQEYEKFVSDSKKATEEVCKSFDPVDNEKIIAKSGFGPKSSVELAAVRSEFDKLVRDDLAQKNRSATESEVERRIEQAMQSLVDDLAKSSSETSDFDYDPAEDQTDIVVEVDDEDDQEDEEEEEVETDADWRAQLVDAMKYVRAIGRSDGEMLAEQIAETFYESNGREASVEELQDVFGRIQQELAFEAEDEISEEIESVDPEKVIENSTLIVEQNLVSRALESFKICYQSEPSIDELTEMVQKMALRLADRAIAGFVEAC